jgi:hypothetical protein
MDAQLEGFLNSLGEAERAGGRVLHELPIRVDRRLRSQDLIETLTDAMLMRGVPEYIVRTIGRSSSRERYGDGF